MESAMEKEILRWIFGFFDDMENSFQSVRQHPKALPKTFEEIISAVLYLSTCPVIHCIGCGKSRHVAQKVSSTFSSCGIESYAPSCEELLHGSCTTLHEGDGFIFFTKSGNTEEIWNVLACIDTTKCHCVFITCSDVFEQYGKTVLLQSEDEFDTLNLLPTKSALLMMLFGDIICACIAKEKGTTYKEMHVAHPYGFAGDMLRRDVQLKERRIFE